jgi:hypothetical protein
VGERRNAFKILVRKLNLKTPLTRPRYNSKHIKNDFEEIVWCCELGF